VEIMVKQLRRIGFAVRVLDAVNRVRCNRHNKLPFSSHKMPFLVVCWPLSYNNAAPGQRFSEEETPRCQHARASNTSTVSMRHATSDIIIYTSPSTGDPVGTSFIIPKTPEDLLKRRRMMQSWAEYTCGMMGRSPDFVNINMMDFALWHTHPHQGEPADRSLEAAFGVA
jgi:hypothetical protein